LIGGLRPRVIPPRRVEVVRIEVDAATGGEPAAIALIREEIPPLIAGVVAPADAVGRDADFRHDPSRLRLDPSRQVRENRSA
jgi:hypothetical protein